MPHIRSGKLRSLAVCSAERSRFLPEVPTMVEQGFTDVALSEWLGWFLPANTPAEIVRNLNQIVREGLQAPSMIEGLANGGLEPRHMSPDQFRAQLQQDFDRWAAIVKSTGFTMTE